MSLILFLLLFYCIFCVLFSLGAMTQLHTNEDDKCSLGAYILTVVFSPILLPFFLGARLSQNDD